MNRTLAAAYARAEMRTESDFAPRPERPQRRRPGPVGRLAGFTARAMWKRFSPEMDFAGVREELRQHLERSVGEGFVEPAVGRFQIDFGYYAVMRFNGQHYSGASGMPLQGRHRSKEQQDEPLELLARLRGATGARDVGGETVRGVPCRAVTVTAGAAEYTVYVDEEHVRRVRSQESGPGDRPRVSVTRTLDLWDFGGEDRPADWTRLPSFRTPAPGPAPERP